MQKILTKNTDYITIETDPSMTYIRLLLVQLCRANLNFNDACKWEALDDIMVSHIS